MTEAAQSFPGAFCEPCNKWRKPGSLLRDGSCPKCGTHLEDHQAVEPVDGSVEAPAAGSAESPVAAHAEAEPYKVPWHFWVMVAATVLYLGWRVIQGIQALL